MVDRPLLARKIAAVRDAVARVRAFLPADAAAFAADRTAREVVTLNVLVALQECIDLASHWIADAGLSVPQSYRDLFAALGEQGVIDPALAARLAAAAGLRNLIAHGYGALDWGRLHAVARADLADLEVFCAALAQRAGAE
ncbi:MAG TPA: HepT-like ribonuclease domain-containing protein [Myxococcota bacterium]|jgi:uncharacterized protein YutE (UPF0331/DUF86 family)|nr:HepT-like ribonuclease domain-containing protein [Myxococcota bacterium]